MLTNLMKIKMLRAPLSLHDYYVAVDEILKKGITKDTVKFVLSLTNFGMSKREVGFLAQAIRDNGTKLNFNNMVLEKHSTGGVGDSTSVVMIPLIASLGYKIIKTTAKSLVFTNGSADRFGAIPNFNVVLNKEQIDYALETTNSCVISHDGDICPVDKILYQIREMCGIENDINLLAASIASKKLASGAKTVLIDIKYGYASLVSTYAKAQRLAKILKYIFRKNGVKCVIVITNTLQTIGDAVGNAVEALDAIEVLKGKHCLLRDIAVKYTAEIILKTNKKLSKKDVLDMINASLDNGSAYETFLHLVKAQGGDVEAVEQNRMFVPYKSVNFLADRDGFVGSINSLLLGELIRRLCKESHDNNIGVVLRVKIGDIVKKGDKIVTFYYKEDEDFELYKKAIVGCIRVTKQKMKPVKVIRRIIR